MSQASYRGPALFHVVFPKTATTFLQEVVFCDAARGMALAGGRQHRALATEMFRPWASYAFDAPATTRRMADVEAPIRDSGLIPVWSEETLLGNPPSRDYHGPFVLSRMRLLDRPLKILITIREQQGLVLSTYRETLRTQRFSLRQFIGTGDEPISFRPVMDPDYLRFDEAVAHWAGAFGQKNVLVLPQEMLKADADGYMARLAAFLDLPDVGTAAGSPRNQGLGGTALLAARHLNGLFVRSPLGGGPSPAERVVSTVVRGVNKLAPASLDRRVEDGLRRAIRDRYAGVFGDSNARLQRLADLNLARLGYEVASGDGLADGDGLDRGQGAGRGRHRAIAARDLRR